jgi:putative hydrolase of the HAD superfamily
MSPTAALYDAVIFDFGGVIIDLDYHATIRAFDRLCGRETAHLYSQQQQKPLFDAFETGAIAAAEFRDGLRDLLAVEASDAELDDAWNAMLGRIPAHKVDFLHRFGQQRPIFLLSNTNEIHKAAFDRIFTEDHGHTHSGLSDLFVADYYSHRMGDRKPNPSIYRTVVEAHGLDPARTLFIDDTAHNLPGAADAGLLTWHLQPGECITSLEGVGG